MEGIYTVEGIQVTEGIYTVEGIQVMEGIYTVEGIQVGDVAEPNGKKEH